MGENSELITRILDIEWNMFTTVNNEGGRAACQDDRLTFEVMRRSQFEAWDRDSLESYYADLTVFNEETIRKAEPDRQESFGMERVFINGREVLREGKMDEEALKTAGRSLPVM